ncbi:MAG: hypothetical protein ABI218_06705 [Caldimonas sp.]
MVVILLAFFAAWLAMPSFREWAERPKHEMLSREALFDVDRPEANK